MDQTSPKKRPSRLLNLNKSPHANKQISTNNASRSPLLALPPEIRTRIYDYVFDIGVIHIGHPQRRARGYELSICSCPDVYQKKPTRVHPESPSKKRKKHPYGTFGAHHEDCICTNSRSVLQHDLHLGFLETCRLIYHESVLKPFSLNEFQYTAYYLHSRNNSTIQLFVDAMAPTQARAIKRLRIVSDSTSFPSPVVVRQLKGLEHLNIEIECSTSGEWCMRRLRAKKGVAELRNLSLKTVYISLEVHPHYMRLARDTAAIIASQERLEEKILKKA